MQAAAVCDSTAPAATTGHQQVCRCARNAKRTTPRLPPARRGGVLVDRAEAEAGDLARPGHHGHGEVAVAFHTCRQAATDRTSKRRARVVGLGPSDEPWRLPQSNRRPQLAGRACAASIRRHCGGWASTASCAAARVCVPMSYR